MPLNKSGRITLGQIYNEFLPQTNTAKHSISEYYRTGANVPDIFENKNIPIHEPTAALRGRVNWSDYYGTSAVVRPYTTALPAIDEDDFWRHCEGSPNYWTALQDNWKQYVTRKDGAYCVMLEVRTPYARIEVQHAQTRLGTEVGEDSGYEKLLRNTNLNTDYFPFGEWTMTIPRKITRFRIIATAGGGSGSVQKITANDRELKGTLTPIIEEGHDGGTVFITANDLTVKVLGGMGGGKSMRLFGTDKNFDPTSVQVTGSAAVSTNKLYKYADSPQARKIYGITNAATAGESAAFLPVINPERHKKQSSGANEMDWFAGSEYPINMIWWEDSLYGQVNSAAGGNGSGGDSVWSDGYFAADEHPNQGEPFEPNSTDWGTGGAAGQHAQRGALTYGGDASPTTYLGDFETAPGEEITIKVPEGGVQSINLYTDYNQTDKDNFTPSLADRDQYANHPVYGTGFYVGSSYVSKSGKGGDGFVQIFGATGRAYSEMSHTGTVLLDEDYNIVQQKFSSATSLKGVDNYNPSYTMPYIADVLGTEDPNVPKIYYVAYTGRIRKNGLIESKTQFKSDGCSVSVTPVTEDLAIIAPSSANGSILNLESWFDSESFGNFGAPYPVTSLRKKLYCEPEFSSDEPIVSGRRGSNAADDFEDVGNVFADSCNVIFKVHKMGGTNPRMTFRKTPSSEMGIGPSRINFHEDGTISYVPYRPPGIYATVYQPEYGNSITIGVGEEYVCGGPDFYAPPPTNTAVSFPTTAKLNYLLCSTSYVTWTLQNAKTSTSGTAEPGKYIYFQTMIQGNKQWAQLRNNKTGEVKDGTRYTKGDMTSIRANAAALLLVYNKPWEDWNAAQGTAEVSFDYKMIGGGHGGTGKGYIGVDPESDTSVEVDYDMVGGGSGGHGLGISSWGEPNDGFVADFPGSPGGIGGGTILTLDSITGTQLANTGVATYNLVQRKLNWNGETYGNGGISWAYRHRDQGGSSGYWKPSGATPDGASGTGIDVGRNGLTASGTVSLQVGQTIHITIGQGGSGGARNSGIHYGDGSAGSNGAVLIQGVLYTSDATHTVTATPSYHFEPAAGSAGGSTVLSKSGTQIASTPILAAHAFNAGQSPRGWEGSVQGNGGRNREYSAPIDGVVESLNNGYAQNGGEASGAITANIGDEFVIVIGEGGIGSNDADPLSNQKAPDGQNGGIIIQGVKYYTSGTHVVTGTVIPPAKDDVCGIVEITSTGGKWWVDGRKTWFSCSVETPADGESLGVAYNLSLIHI